MTVFDIGAHEGEVTKVLSQAVGSAGVVIAFEPHPKKFEILSGKRLQNVRYEPLAVADIQGETDFYYGDDQFADQASTIVRELATTERLGQQIHVIPVRTTTVDSYCEQHKQSPSFIKIDVEGAEPQVLQGALKTMRQMRPIIIFELGVKKGMPLPASVNFLLGNTYILNICDLFCIPNGWDDYQSSASGALVDQLIEFDAQVFSEDTHLANILAIPAETWPTYKTRTPIVPWKRARGLLQPRIKPPTDRTSKQAIVNNLKSLAKRSFPQFARGVLEAWMKRLRQKA